MEQTPGSRFRDALKIEWPLQLPGVANAYIGLMAREQGFRALYLSGAAIANFCHGLPDLGMTTCSDVAAEVGRLASAVDLPILVDIDTGWGDPAAAVKLIEGAGAAAVHIEDQREDKRCGHREGKRLVSKDEMCRRIDSAISGKKDPDFVVMARTDSLAVEGVEAALARSAAYREAGADMLFVEAVEDISLYKRFHDVVGLPLLANMTEFGKTPLVTVQELAAASVSIILYPLTVARVMNHAAEEALKSLRREGSQERLLPIMQNRKELYRYLDYDRHEEGQRR